MTLRVRRVLLLLVMLVAPMRIAGAQGGFLMQGVTDFDFWKTDSASTLLARGSGHPAVVARADIWAAFESWRNVVLFAGDGGQVSLGDTWIWNGGAWIAR